MFQKIYNHRLLFVGMFLMLAFASTSFAQQSDKVGLQRTKVDKSSSQSAKADKIGICHATSSESNPYNYLELPASAVRSHFQDNGTPQAGHEQDFMSMTGNCNRVIATPTPIPGGTPAPPSPTPEPITMLLFGAGLAGVGYATRRFGKKKDGEAEDDK